MLDGTPLSHAAHCGAPLSQAELGFRSWSAGLDFLALRALFRAASHTVTNRTGAGAHLAVLDVGANVGGGSLLLAEEFQQATVFSFEPQPLVRARLQRALSVANASHGYRFHVVPNAVSNVHGKAVPFYTPRTHSASDSFTGSGLAPRTGFSVTTSNSHTVTTVRIDSWCRAMGLTPSFVKIDTEGFDAFVLDGMDGLLASHTPRALIFELNPRLWPGAAKAMAADGRPHANVAPVASRVAEHRADRNRKVTLVDAAYSLSLHQLQYALEKYGYAVYMLSPRKLLRMHASCWQEQYAHWTATMNVVAVQRGKTEHGLVATYASVAGTLMPGAMRPSEPQAQAPQKRLGLGFGGPTPLTPELQLVAPQQNKFRTARIFHVHRSRASNLGDCFSSPLQHLPLLNSATTATFDIEESAVANVAAFAIDKRDLIIVGGGGLLDIKDAWTAQLLHYCSYSSCLMWGPGLNSKPGVSMSKSTVSILQFASATWLRDFGLDQLKSSSVTFRSMLDASCLMPELDQKCIKERAVGYYLRGEFDFARKHRVNAWDVWHNTGSVGDALRFICTSKSIVTNSYHGLLWAAYMGVPAKLDGSHRSAKFHYMPFRPKLWTPGPSTVANVDGVALKATCRAQNMRVYEKHVLPIVLRVLGLSPAETAVVQRRALILTVTRNAAEAQKYRFAQFTHQWYSARHDVKVSVCPSELQNRSFWLKLECIERHMTVNVSWILWLDSDVVITALLPIERWTREAELRGANVIAQHMGTRINNGVFLIRNSAGGRNFLRAWQKASWRPYAHDNGHFNVAALDLYDSRRCHGPWTMDSEAKSKYDRCFNQIMSEDPSMCRHTTGAPQHFMLESGVWVICPRSGLVPPLQSEDAARSAKQHVPSTVWKPQDFTLHSKTPLAYLESVLNRSRPDGRQIRDVIRNFGTRASD
jgi:FkbM family methyltransferase